MVKGLKQEMDKFALEIKETYPDYSSIYSYFIDYIDNIAYEDDIELDDFLKNEFSRLDIIKSCAYYYENSNAKSITAINKYLSSMTKFYETYMKIKGYENQNLFYLGNFAKLKNDVRSYIKEKKILEKDVFPPISDIDFVDICKYFNENTNPTNVQRQISIIFKLIMLYGLKLERIRNMEKGHFDSRQRLLTLFIEDERKIILELPYSLSLEIESYLNSPKCNESIYMFLRGKDKIASDFFAHTFLKIKKYKNDNSLINKFTTTGLAKYAIIKMLEAGMNVPVIKIVSGMDDDVINDCTKKVYELDKFIKLNRYINSKIRAIDVYDEMDLPIYVEKK